MNTNSVKIFLTCPNCGNGSWVRVEDGFECAACGDVCETEEMSSIVTDICDNEDINGGR